MTTTVYDLLAKVVTSDTRWSIDLTESQPPVVVYVDKTDFAKISDRYEHVLVLAGFGPLIAEWKRWWVESLDEENTPDFEINGIAAVAVLIVDKVQNKVLTKLGPFHANRCGETSRLLSAFSGSGGIHAAKYWQMHQCAWASIVDASEKDVFTSEFVNFVDFDSNTTNIEINSHNYADITSALIERGFVMDVNTKKSVPLSQSALAATITAKIQSGAVFASAPMPGLSEFKWTTEKKDEFKAAIRSIKQSNAGPQ